MRAGDEQDAAGIQRKLTSARDRELEVGLRLGRQPDLRTDASKLRGPKSLPMGRKASYLFAFRPVGGWEAGADGAGQGWGEGADHRSGVVVGEDCQDREHGAVARHLG